MLNPSIDGRDVGDHVDFEQLSQQFLRWSYYIMGNTGLPVCYDFRAVHNTSKNISKHSRWPRAVKRLCVAQMLQHMV